MDSLSNKMAEIVGDKVGITQDAVSIVLKTFLKLLEEKIIKEKKVYLHNFGSFVIKRHKARKGRVLKRGKVAIEPVEIIIPACNKIKFIPCERLKKKINS